MSVPYESEQGRLVEKIAPYFDYERMELLKKTNRVEYMKLRNACLEKYGVDKPLIEDAPLEIVSAYKKLAKILVKNKQYGITT